MLDAGIFNSNKSHIKSFSQIKIVAQNACIYQIKVPVVFGLIRKYPKIMKKKARSIGFYIVVLFSMAILTPLVSILKA